MVVHATASSKDGMGPICRWRKGAGKGKRAAGEWDCKGIIITVEDIEQAANQFGGRFCANCEPLLRASLRLQVRQLWLD